MAKNYSNNSNGMGNAENAYESKKNAYNKNASKNTAGKNASKSSASSNKTSNSQNCSDSTDRY